MYQNKTFILPSSIVLICILIMFGPTSHHDRPFVKKEVIEYLEEEFGFKLRVHERDCMVGDTLPANIDVAINHSRRMIMVLSR